MPRLNWALSILYALATLAVFVAALLFPAFRSLAYAPLRELVIPPPQPIEIYLLYSTEKEDWLKEVIPEFEASGASVNGRPIHVRLAMNGSREILLSVLGQSEQPDIISPASSLQISILQDQSPNVFGRPIVNPADAVNCRPMLHTPLVLVSWRERADVLWGEAPRETCGICSTMPLSIPRAGCCTAIRSGATSSSATPIRSSQTAASRPSC